MFQYYDSNKREYIDFDSDINEFLENSKELLPCKKVGDHIYVFDFGKMTQIDLFNNVSRKIRKV